MKADTDLRAFSTYSDAELNVTCKYGGAPDYGYGTVSRRFPLKTPVTIWSSLDVLADTPMSFLELSSGRSL